METYYKINDDLTAELTDNEYLLKVRSESLDDYDCYRLDEDRDWEQSYDSLTNQLPAASEIWECEKFCAWAKKMAKKANR